MFRLTIRLTSVHDTESIAGKTTVLRELLSQPKYKIGCVVNDVAAVNIDAKLVRNQTTKQAAAPTTSTTSDLAPTIELQNGCACTFLSSCVLSCTQGIK